MVRRSLTRRRKTRLYKRPADAVETADEFFGRAGEAHAEMRRCIEETTGSDGNAVFGGESGDERRAVRCACNPWKHH